MKKQILLCVTVFFLISQQVKSENYLVVDAMQMLVLEEVNNSAGSKIIIGLITHPNVVSYNQIQENKSAFLAYNVTEEKKKALKSELDKEKIDEAKLIAQGIVFIVVILSLVLYFRLLLKYKKEKFYQVYETETRIAKKVHDEVANDLYLIITKLQHTNSKSNEKLLVDLDDIYNKTRDISREHSNIDLRDNFETQIEDIIMSFNSNSTKIITKNWSNINLDKFGKTQKITIYRVLQELLVNMKKHSEASSVMLSFHQKGKKLTINYSDNGTGCDLIKQNGLMNTENRIHSINGTIKFESKLKKGFKVKIEI